MRKPIIGLSEEEVRKMGGDPDQFICDPVNYGVISIDTRKPEEERRPQMKICDRCRKETKKLCESERKTQHDDGEYREECLQELREILQEVGKEIDEEEKRRSHK